MNGDYERVLSREPLVLQRRVRWAECDPAGVVYTGRFSDYLLSAAAHLFDVLAGEQRYMDWLAELAVDTPCKGMALEFHGALWPDDVFEMHCGVTAIRQHSYDITVQARQADGRKVFTGRFSPVCISRQVRQRVPIPHRMLDRLGRHAPASLTQEHRT